MKRALENMNDVPVKVMLQQDLISTSRSLFDSEVTKINCVAGNAHKWGKLVEVIDHKNDDIYDIEICEVCGREREE